MPSDDDEEDDGSVPYDDDDEDDGSAPDDDDAYPGYPPPLDAQAALYSAPGSFGTLGSTLDTGESLSKIAVDNWRFEPGQTSFFTEMASDGTVFIANMAQTYNPFLPTQCTSVITCFNPTERVCWDADRDRADHFANLRVPRFDGGFFAPEDGENSCASYPRGRGADVSDLVLLDLSGREEIFFNSLISSVRPSPDSFPAVGKIRSDDDDVWRIDDASLLWSNDLQRGSTDSCVNRASFCESDSDCPGGFCDRKVPFGACRIACATDAECPGLQTCVDDACGLADCGGLCEVSQLPASGRMVATQYTGYRLSVLDSDGVPLATYQLPPIEDPCRPGVTLFQTSPRAVQVDPLSVLGDERFVVSYDTEHARGMPSQEFSYSEYTKTIVPISAPFLPTTAYSWQRMTCSQPKVGTHAAFDSDGNLWIDTNFGIGGGPLYMYRRDPVTGRRRLETECSYLDPDTGEPRPFAEGCIADMSTGQATVFRTASRWTTPWSHKWLEDPVTGTRWNNGVWGQVLHMDKLSSTAGAPVYAIKRPLDLGLSHLPRVAPEKHFTSEGVIDALRRDLWIPVVTAIDIESCGFFDCVYDAGVTRDAWLYRLRIDELVAKGIDATRIVAPNTSPAGHDISVGADVELTDYDRVRSRLVAYHDGAARPSASVPWTQGHCSDGVCRYSATISAEVTDGRPGHMEWHAIFWNHARTESLHLAGLIEVTP